MTSKAAILALLTLWGVGAPVSTPSWAQDAVPTESSDSDDDASPENRLTDRVWVKSGEDELPGVLRIFLSDGTLVQDSCWETHRLSNWQMDGETAVSWSEDGVEIKADIVTLTADELVLSLKLRGGDVEERYQPAAVPYVCPDVPRA